MPDVKECLTETHVNEKDVEDNVRDPRQEGDTIRQKGAKQKEHPLEVGQLMGR